MSALKLMEFVDTALVPTWRGSSIANAMRDIDWCLEEMSALVRKDSKVARSPCVVCSTLRFFFVIDIDECRSEPGICRNGQCTNTIGSFECSCPQGFVLSSNGRECKGRCFQPFLLRTHPYPDLWPLSDVRKAQCFDRFEAGRCTSPRPMLHTKAQCCCSRGQAWGSNPCEICPQPHQGESLFWYLVCNSI